MTRRRILLKIEIFALIFAVLLSSVTFVVKIKAAPEDTSSAISPFYDEAFNSLDAIFFGTSHMLNGLLPLELYRNYGIASFNYAQHGQSFPLTYESIKETTRFQKPQILVVDLYGMVAFDFARNWNSEYSWLHYVTDNIPFVSKFYLAKNYLEYRNDTFNNFYEIMFPFYLYHSRWEEISLVDYFVSSTQKGAIPLFSIFNANSINSLTNERELLPYKWEQKILNIIDFCENKRIELLFIVIPYGNIDKKSYCYYNAVEWLIKGKKHIC